MEKNYAELTKRISGGLRKLRKDIPDTMQAFSALAQAATRDGAITPLFLACKNGSAPMIELLLKAGADANYSGSMDGKANSASALKPLALAQAMLEVVTQVQASQIEANLRESGLDDAALLKSATDPKAADRYQKVVDLLAKATK